MALCQGTREAIERKYIPEIQGPEVLNLMMMQRNLVSQIERSDYANDKDSLHCMPDVYVKWEAFDPEDDVQNEEGFRRLIGLY